MALRERRSAAVLLLAAALLTGCAGRGVVAGPPLPGRDQAQVERDALVEHGCYRCLERAYAVSTDGPSADSSPNAAGDTPSRQPSPSAFEVALLLTARAKELGLPYQPWLERARSHLPAGADWANYVTIVEALRVDPLSDDRDVVLADTITHRPSRDTVAAWRADLGTGAGSPLLRAYLDLSLVCQFQGDERETSIAALMPHFPHVPLLEYRAGLCGASQAAHLEAAREAEPGFTDIEFALARYALDIPRQPDQEEALQRLTSARASFPESPAMVASLGDLRRDREEWSDALEAYDAAIALVPTHRDALLGRMVALSHLGRYDEAIDGATRIIGLGSWFTGEAFYWRAWNAYHLARIADARADTDRAKGLMRSAPVLVLSGLIEWHEHRLAAAESELLEALTVDAGQCEAAFVLGSVRTEQRLWAAGAAAFELAHHCYDLSVTLRREAIARITAGPGSDAGKARQIARQERAMSEESQHRDEAALNAERLQKRAGA